MPTPLLNRRRVRLLVLMFGLLVSLYLITYSARIESGDTRRFFDAVSSFADYGDFYLDLATMQFPPQTFDAQLVYPLQSAAVEPLQVILAVPLYLLARIVPGIGLVQTVYLFNVLIGAAAGCILFLYTLALDYSERTALLAVLAFGVGTVIFPYTKSFFREPLVLLMLLLCALLIERLRANGYHSLLLLIAVILAVVGLLLAKASAVLAIPALLVIAVPTVRNINWRRLLIILGAVAALVALIFVVLGVGGKILGVGDRYNLSRLFGDATATYILTALQAYLLSIGGSIWGTSPIVLLALPGMWLLVRRGHARYPLAILLLVGAFAFGYAALNGQHWFGGLSWPPRFLVPVVPFLILGALPIFERMGKQPLWAILGAVLLIYSVWVQLSGVTLAWDEYPRALPPEAGGLIEWGAGLNELHYLRWVVIPSLWRTIPLDIAWTVINAPGMMIAYAGLVLASAVELIRSLHRASIRLLPALILLALLIVVTGCGLHLLYNEDPRYLSGDSSLTALLPILDAETDSSDVILLSSPRYEPFFANAAKLISAGRVIALPLQPGEQSSPEQEPLVRSDDPDVLLTKETIQLIFNLAATRDRLWLLVDGSPDLAWSVRPVERFMSSHYYAIRTIQTGELTRLIEYSTISAPDQFAYREPEHLTDLTFGEHIRLVGVDLPAGSNYQAGDVLALSLYWKTDAPLDANYSVGLYLRDANGSPIAQIDAQPAFSPTSGWQIGVPVWDNRALRLPVDLPPGDYQVWIKLYDFDAAGAVRDLPVTAGDYIDDSIGVLPLTIHVG